AMEQSETAANRMATRPAMEADIHRRAKMIASTSAEAAAMIMTVDGVGTRRSARLNPPNPRTVPVIARTAIVVSSAGIRASQGETYPKARAATAAGIIS